VGGGGGDDAQPRGDGRRGRTNIRRGGSYECQSMRTIALGCVALVNQLLTGT